jgi:hypothetical protein
MKPWVICCKFLPANAMALFPFILIKKQSDQTNSILINHEKIHLRQQLELLVIPFYLLYLINYIINLVGYKKHYLAYLNICFEREAYGNERNLMYLKHRQPFVWRKFI